MAPLGSTDFAFGQVMDSSDVEGRKKPLFQKGPKKVHHLCKHAAIMLVAQLNAKQLLKKAELFDKKVATVRQQDPTQAEQVSAATLPPGFSSSVLLRLSCAAVARGADLGGDP